MPRQTARSGSPQVLPASFAGAVDLSPLRSTAPPTSSNTATDAGTAAGNATAPANAIAITEANFSSEVLQRSLNVPVIVDFWAEWCQPCKQLSPLLERLAAEANGSWVLAAVDVDANQRLAAAFRVQSIPMVVAIAGGQPLDAFLGALPEAELRQWLAAVLQAASAGVGAAAAAAADEGAPAIDPQVAQAQEQARNELARRLEGVDQAVALSKAQQIPDDLAAALIAADIEVATDQAVAGYARLVDQVRRTTGTERDAARTRLLELFTIAPPDDDEVRKARRDLANALF